MIYPKKNSRIFSNGYREPNEEYKEPWWLTFPNSFQQDHYQHLTDINQERTYYKLPLNQNTFKHNNILKKPNYIGGFNQNLPQIGFNSLTTYYKYQWIEKEILFAMNKLSIIGMISGLMFLGALFFISGFLLALNLYGLPKIAEPQSIGVQNFSSSHLPKVPSVAAPFQPFYNNNHGERNYSQGRATEIDVMGNSHRPTQQFQPPQHPSANYNSQGYVQPPNRTYNMRSGLTDAAPQREYYNPNTYNISQPFNSTPQNPQ